MIIKQSQPFDAISSCLKYLIYRHLFTGLFAAVFASSPVYMVMGQNLAVAAESTKSDQSAKKQAQKTALRPLSPIEKLVFDKDHFQGLSKGENLVYSFKRTSLFGDSFSDNVNIKVEGLNGAGGKDVSFQLFSGKNFRPAPNLSKVKSNPIITLMMNRDVWTIARKISAKGTANFLRNRILEALEKRAKLEDIKIDTPQGPVKAQKISFRPYTEFENRKHLMHYADYSYELIFSDDIPGGLYQMRMKVPMIEGELPENLLSDLRKSKMVQMTKEVELIEKNRQKKIILEEVLQFNKLEPAS